MFTKFFPPFDTRINPSSRVASNVVNVEGDLHRVVIRGVEYLITNYLTCFNSIRRFLGYKYVINSGFSRWSTKSVDRTGGRPVEITGSETEFID